MRKLIFILTLICTINCFGYKISNAGKNLIKKHETCSLTAYWDVHGYSIGWGHHGKDVKRDMKISKFVANVYFNKDIKMVEEGANRLIKALPYQYKFSQGFFDGLCSLIYNCGEYGVKTSKFYKHLKNCRVKNGKMNTNDYNFTIASVKTTKISCPGHKARRYDEHKIMLS